MWIIIIITFATKIPGVSVVSICHFLSFLVKASPTRMENQGEPWRTMGFSIRSTSSCVMAVCRHCSILSPPGRSSAREFSASSNVIPMTNSCVPRGKKGWDGMGKGGLAPCDDLGSPNNSPDVTSVKDQRSSYAHKNVPLFCSPAWLILSQSWGPPKWIQSRMG